LYSIHLPSWANYAGIGTTIAHEISHAFDPKGRQIDARGTIRDWWGSDSTVHYREQGQCFVDQYDQFSVTVDADKISVSGNQTLDENIADQLGFQLAWASWKASQEENTILPSFAQYSQDQLFFMAYGAGFCSKATKEYQKQLLHYDNHAPEFARINGIAMNSPEFARAFQCPLGSPMNPVKKCTVW
jgi:predicted metalloendopeptidase